MADRLFLACCDHYRLEAEAAIASGSMPEVRLATLPPACDPPGFRWAAIEKAFAAAGREEGEEAHVLGGGCLRTAGPPPPSMAPAVVHPADHCLDLLAGKTLVAHWFSRKAFVMSGGWLARWRERLGAWGMDAATASAFFGESTDRLVLLDSGLRPGIAETLAEFGAHLGIPCEVVPVGLDHFSLVLSGIVADWRLRMTRNASVAELSEANLHASELAMAMDLIEELAAPDTEADVVRKALDLFNLLFAPTTLLFLRSEDSQDSVVFHPDSERGDRRGTVADFLGRGEESAAVAGGSGFLLRISRRGETLGALLVDGLRFPEYRDRYVPLARTVAKVFALSISNAVSYGQLRETVARLREALENVKTLKGLIPICMHCKKIRDDGGYWQRLELYIHKNSDAELSHGICPECLDHHYPGVL